VAKKIKLVLSGSGTLYPVHIGGILRLVEDNYEIIEVCGTSGGALVAAALASGYKANKELVKIVKQTIPSKHGLLDFSLISLLKDWGFIKGDKIEKMLSKYLVNSLGDAKIPIHIVTVNLDRRVHKIFSSKNDPGMSMSKAVRASMSIPGVFAPVIINGERHVDGGISANYFIDMFGEGEDVVGLRFHSSAGEYKKIENVKDYVSATIETMLESNMREHIEDAIFARTIILNSKYSGLNFRITDKDVDEMIKEGYTAVDKWLKLEVKKSNAG
jgi:NTE family protein